MKYLKIFVVLFSLTILLPKGADACNCYFGSKQQGDDRKLNNIQNYNTIFIGKLVEIKTDKVFRRRER